MVKTPTLSQCIEGYLIAAQARRLSPHTIADYSNTFRRLQRFLDADPPIDRIDVAQVLRFMAGLSHLSKKTALNIHTGLSALWRWAETEKLVARNIVREIPAPVPEERAIVPLSQDDVKKLLAAVGKTRPYTRPGKAECSHELHTALRNRAIILLLLDTGLRASELAGVRVRNVDQRNRHLTVMGKGSKERSVPFSPPTGQAIWRYLATRPDDTTNDALFVSTSHRQLNKDDVRRMLGRLADRAGVQGVHPHRFRHTFAINFLRNGGNVYVLKMLLGHSSLDMCLRYLALAESDSDANHKIASPVMNWRL